jgi:hypothetical protein
MTITNEGVFKWTDISKVWADHKVYISATSRGGVKSSPALHHVLTVRITKLCG